MNLIMILTFLIMLILYCHTHHTDSPTHTVTVLRIISNPAVYCSIVGLTSSKCVVQKSPQSSECKSSPLGYSIGVVRRIQAIGEPLALIRKDLGYVTDL